MATNGSAGGENTEQSPLLGAQRARSVEPTGQGAVEDGELSNARLLSIMCTIWVGVFLGALDSTIVATLSAPISDSFDSFTLISWLASAYLIANAALMPLFGRLTDIFGRRAGLLFSNIFFGAGNLICGLAQAEWVILSGRVIAGLGGGGLMAITTFIASDLIPLRRRGLWQGIGNVFYGLGAGLGGVFGGWMSDVYNWRLAFLVQVPLCCVSTLLVFFLVKTPAQHAGLTGLKRVDFPGAITLIVSLLLLLVGLNSGGNLVPWSHPLIYTTLPLAVTFLLLFVYIEDRVAKEPIIPVRLLLNRTVACACLTNWFTTMASYAFLYYVPIYFEVRGYSAGKAGLRLIPNSLGGATASILVGLVMRTTGRYYRINIIFEAFLVLGAALIAATFDRNAPEFPPFLYVFFGGLGYGGMLVITLLALISAVDHSEQAVITSASYAFRSTGSVIGVTIASAVFQNGLKYQLWLRFAGRKDAAAVIARLRDSTQAIQHLPEEWYDGVIDSYMVALRGVWITALGLAVLGSAISLGMREHKLHATLSRRPD